MVFVGAEPGGVFAEDLGGIGFGVDRDRDETDAAALELVLQLLELLVLPDADARAGAVEEADDVGASEEFFAGHLFAAPFGQFESAQPGLVFRRMGRLVVVDRRVVVGAVVAEYDRVRRRTIGDGFPTERTDDESKGDAGDEDQHDVHEGLHGHPHFGARWFIRSRRPGGFPASRPTR